MIFEGSQEEFEQFDNMDPEDAIARLKEFDNVFYNNREKVLAKTGKKDGPYFWIQRIPFNAAAASDFDNQRIRIWISEFGGIQKIGVG